MKILKYILAAAILGGVTSARAQDTVSHQQHEPGGVNKGARDVSKTFRKGERDSTAELKRTSSRTHTALTKAGKDTKAGKEAKAEANGPLHHGFVTPSRSSSHSSIRLR
jgi:hypothetical protein